jgi:hypothetical protein
MLAAAAAVIGVVEAVGTTAVVVAGLRTLMRVCLAWCTRRHIPVQLQMDR